MKITDDVRRHVVKAISEAKYPRSTRESIEATMKRVAYEAALATVPSNVRELWEELPGYFEEENNFYFLFKGFEDAPNSYRDERVINVVCSDGIPTCGGSIGVPYCESYETLLALRKRLEVLKEEKDALEAATFKVLRSYTTVESLKKDVPELIEYFPATLGVTALVPKETIENFRNLLKTIPTDEEVSNGNS